MKITTTKQQRRIEKAQRIASLKPSATAIKLSLSLRSQHEKQANA